MEILPLATYPPPPEGRTVSDPPPSEEMTGPEEAEQAEETEQPEETEEPRSRAEAQQEDGSRESARGGNVDTYA